MAAAKDDPRKAGDFNDPDRQNSEQDETGAQTQDIAEEALTGQDGNSEESDPASPSNPADVIPRDVPDLVEKMKEMRKTGRLDLNAFEGEEDMDDEPTG